MRDIPSLFLSWIFYYSYASDQAAHVTVTTSEKCTICKSDNKLYNTQKKQALNNESNQQIRILKSR